LAGIEKAKEVLGYEVRVDFKEGLRRTINFYNALTDYTDFTDKDS